MKARKGSLENYQRRKADELPRNHNHIKTKLLTKWQVPKAKEYSTRVKKERRFNGRFYAQVKDPKMTCEGRQEPRNFTLPTHHWKDLNKKGDSQGRKCGCRKGQRVKTCALL